MTSRPAVRRSSASDSVASHWKSRLPRPPRVRVISLRASGSEVASRSDFRLGRGVGILFTQGEEHLSRLFLFTIFRMDTFTSLFWVFTVMFIGLSAYLLTCKKRSNTFYLQVASGCGIFATSKLGRKFLGLA